MGAVGINFGAATSGTGFDVSTTVASIVANLQQVETPWNTQLTALKADDTALTSIGTDLATLSTSLQALTDFEGVMAEKEGSSSDTNVLTLTSASPTASAGSHTVVVSQLAQTSSDYSERRAASDTLSGGLTIQVGSPGHPSTVPVVSGSSDTLATYAAAINAAGIGVTASVISDTTGSRLSLVSDTSGGAGQLTITGSLTDSTSSSAVSMQTGLTGQDALLTVDGISVDSGSNTVSTAIPGVTFQLLSTSTTPVQVEITNDNTDIEIRLLSTFVSAYNTVLGDLTTQEGNTSYRQPPSRSTATPSSPNSRARSPLALTTGAASGSITSLDQLGITVSNTGTLTLDTSTLDSDPQLQLLRRRRLPAEHRQLRPDPRHHPRQPGKLQPHRRHHPRPLRRLQPGNHLQRRRHRPERPHRHRSGQPHHRTQHRQPGAASPSPSNSTR